ncbi:MAG: AI-2E family transporter [Candidatus Micrarchaeota archaeon]
MKDAPAKSSRERQFNMITAAILVLFLLFVVGSAIWGYLDFLFLALFLFVLLNPVYKFLRSKGLGKTTSGLGAMLIGFLVVGIPVLIVSDLLVKQTLGIMAEAKLFDQNTLSQGVSALNNNLNSLDGMFPELNLKSIIIDGVGKAVSGFVNFMTSLVINSIKNIGTFALGALVTVFTLFYLLVEQDIFAKNLKELFPFNQKNTNILFNEFKKILYSALLCTGLVAVLQAVPLTLVFMYYGVQGSVFWGFAALVLACVPFVGIPFVWIPIAAAEALTGNPGAAIGITIAGVLLALLEYIRPALQKKVGKIHPLITIIGLIIGLANFGILGLLMGPILLSFSLLTIKMFKEEYV